MFRNGSPFGFSGGPFGFAPARRYNVRAYVGKVTTPASGGQATISGFDFDPELLLPASAGMGGSGIQSQGTLGVGIMTREGQHQSIAVSAQHGASPTVTYRRKSSSSINWLSSTGGTGFSFTASSWARSGITLDFPTSLAGREISYAALGGTIRQALTEQTMNTDNAPQSFAHGLGEIPSAIHIIGVVLTSTDVAATNAYMSRGWWANGKQWSQAMHSVHGGTPSVTRRCQSNNKAWIYHSTSGLLRSIKIEGVDSTHVHVTYPNVTSTTAFKFYMIAFAGCRADCGVWNGNRTIAPIQIPVACDPKFCEVASMRHGVTQNDSPQSVALFNLCYSDGVRTRTNGIAEPSSASPATPLRHQDDSFRVYNAASDIRTVADLYLAPRQLTIDVTDTSSTDFFDQGGYLVLGN